MAVITIKTRKQLFCILPEIGNLYIINIYLYYDEPLLFTVKDEKNNLYLVNSIKDDQWLVASVDHKRISSLEDGIMFLRQAFTDTNICFKVLKNEDGYTMQMNPHLYDAILPEENTILGEPMW